MAGLAGAMPDCFTTLRPQLSAFLYTAQKLHRDLHNGFLSLEPALVHRETPAASTWQTMREPVLYGVYLHRQGTAPNAHVRSCNVVETQDRADMLVQGAESPRV